MYTPEQRDEVRDGLLERAREDDRVTGAALTGSAALGNEDRWSDVDVFLGIAESADLDDVVADWTSAALRRRPAPSTTGTSGRARLSTGSSCSRAASRSTSRSLPSWTSAPDLRASSSPSGSPSRYRLPSRRRSPTCAGLGWLGVLHANKAIERGRPWEAAYWIGSVRDQTLALACLRLGESPYYSRGVDRLPPDVTAPLAETFVRGLEPDELRRALRAARRCLLEEIGRTDAELADRLQAALAGG